MKLLSKKRKRVTETMTVPDVRKQHEAQGAEYLVATAARRGLQVVVCVLGH